MLETRDCFPQIADHRGVLASLRDAPLRFELSGGLRCAATPGYFLTSLRDELQASNLNREILAFPQDSR